MRLFFVVLLILPFLTIINAEIMGPFEAVLTSFSTCPVSKSGKRIAIFTSRQERVSRKKFNLFLDLYITKEVPNTFTITCNFAKKTPQGWKENFFHVEGGPICSALKKFFPGVFSDIAKGMQLKENDCPLPEGNYTKIPIRPNIKVEAIPAFFYTTVKAICTVYDKHEIQSCFEVQGDTIPKKS